MNLTKLDLNNVKINEGLAEYYGAMIGDGCLSRYHTKDRKAARTVVLLTGHTHDEPYYKQILQPIVFKEFGVNGSIRFRGAYNVVYFWIESKRVFNFFKLLGFPTGLKIQLSIPNEILSNNKFSLACVRGIFNTDGTIYRRYSKQYKNHARFYNYMVIQIKLNSKEVIQQIHKTMKNSNIKTTKITRDKKSFVIRITDQKEIHKFFKTVKPNNEYHIKRYLNYSSFSNGMGL